jgi:hypothetical protein
VVGIPSIDVVSTSSYIPAVWVPLMFVFRTAIGPDFDVFLVLFFRLWVQTMARVFAIAAFPTAVDVVLLHNGGF